MSRYLLMFTLVLAVEMIFGLPFHTARFFRPTLLEAFNFTNTQLGDLFAAYGLIAMISYFPGGLLADRFSARALMSASLVATGLGGFYMATFPGPLGMALLYGYWGVTTILLFWAAVIRATRDWGGVSSQGQAFGILEGGRGLVAALFATLVTLVFALNFPDDAASLSNEARRSAFRIVILIYSIATIGAALLTWFVIPVRKGNRAAANGFFNHAAIVMTRPLVWAQAAVIICAYCAYKGLDNYSLYAVQVLGMDEVGGAKLSAYGAYVRPVAALAAGLFADRFGSSKAIGLLFTLLLVAYGLLALTVPQGAGLLVIYANIFISLFAVFGLRGVYFSLLEDNKTPAYLTGAATGMVSFVGYTPEIFFGPITGRILDASPGVVGHQHYFLFLTAVMALAIGVVAALLWLRKSERWSRWPQHQRAAGQVSG